MVEFKASEKQWAEGILFEYLRIPTVSAQKRGIQEAVEFLRKNFSELGFEVKTLQAGGNPSVFAEKSFPGAKKTILFYNHYDVQPAEPLEQWTSPPFEPTISNGKIFARGACDNKGHLICRLLAIKHILDNQEKLSVNIKFFVEGEEEIGSPTLEKLLNTFSDLITADLCIWECGGRDEKGRPEIQLGVKGIVTGEFVATGPNVDLHSSRGIIVPNPAWGLVKLLSSLKDNSEKVLIDGFYDDVEDLTKEDYDIIKNYDFDENEYKKSIGIKNFVNNLTGEELVKRYFYEPCININGLSSGYEGEGSKTVLPSKAIAKFDIRLVPNQKPSDIIEKVKKHLEKNGFSNIEIKDAHGYPAARTKPNHPFVKRIVELAKNVYKKEPVVQPMMIGSGPMYIFEKYMPCIGIGIAHPESRLHAPNESIYLDDFYKGSEMIIELLQNF